MIDGKPGVYIEEIGSEPKPIGRVIQTIEGAAGPAFSYGAGAGLRDAGSACR
jgi:hypothetical protein